MIDIRDLTKLDRFESQESCGRIQVCPQMAMPVSELSASKQVILALNGSLNFQGNDSDLNSPEPIEIGGQFRVAHSGQLINITKQNMNVIIFVSTGGINKWTMLKSTIFR